MIDAMFKNWKTITVAVICVVTPVVLVIFDKATFTEAVTGIGLLVGIFFARYMHNSKKNKCPKK